MSHKIGTATNYLDLLDQLDDYLTATGHAWGKLYEGTGTGDMVDYIGTADSVAETFTVELTSATAFTVTGSVSGALAAGTVDTPYTSDVIEFTIQAGGTAFVAGDTFTISTSPKWSRLRAAGCADQTKRSTDLINLESIFDNNIGTMATRAATTCFIDFEMHRATEIREFVLGISGNTANSPRDFSLKYKDNIGDAWTTAQSWSAQTWATNNMSRIYTLTSAPGAHNFWRFEVTAVNGTSVAITELHLREKVDGTFRVGEHAEFVWRAPGLDGTKQIHVGLETYGSAIADTFNLGFNGFRVWDDKKYITEQANCCAPEYLSLINASIGFWLVVNGQRFILATKGAGVYQVAYCGFGLPYELPSVHEYPHIIGASGDTRDRRYNNTTANFRVPMDPGTVGLRAFYPDAQWRDHANRNNTNNTEDSSASSLGGKVWPAALNFGATMPSFYRDNLDGSRALLPGVLSHNASPRHTWGEFDGYYWTSGFSTAAEAIIREDGFDHVVINNCYRTSPQHYSAVRLD